MADVTQKQIGRQKNQLIVKANIEVAPAYVKWIKRAGVAILIISAIWALLIFIILAPLDLFHPSFFWPSQEVKESLLHQWGRFGHAIGGPFELATLGTIVLSFVHVIHQLRMQEQTAKTQFQPVVTCAALLHYNVEGDKDTKVNFVNPQLKLRIRNLGNSPATFIDIRIEELYFQPVKGDPIHLRNSLKNSSIYIDSLAKISSASNDIAYEEVDLPPIDLISKEIQMLINNILAPTGDQTDGDSLTLRICLKHENVMGLEYITDGTFKWSRRLGDIEQSDREQIEYIKNFQSARQNNNEKPPIGQFIKHSQPLQAALEIQIKQ